MKFSPEEINKIISMKGADGKLIDIFDMHGVLFVGNTEDAMWDLSKTYVRYSEHSLGFSVEDFEDCKNEEEIEERFSERLEEAVSEKLV